MMLERLEGIEAEHTRVEAALADPDLLADQSAYTAAVRRYHELEEVVALTRRYRAALADVHAAHELYADAGAADRGLLREEIAESESLVADLEEQLRTALVPPDPNEGRGVIVELRGAEGGEEANLFARDLFEMYLAYATRRGWRIEVLNSSPSPLGGLDEVTFSVTGSDAWTRLKHEGGPHRVQRVPVTESQGRVHTSSATVTVLPEAGEVDVELDPNDLSVEVFRASGPGGQSVNTTDSAVRITHKPTGVVVSMQDQKSQLQNKTKALAVLRSRLLAAEQERRATERSEARRDQTGGGGRSEKVRTYNFKENRLTDHRIGLTIYQLDRVLGGDLDTVVDALVADERTRRLIEYDEQDDA